MAPVRLKENDRGFMVILLAALLLVVLFAFAGFAVDVSRAYVVKGELQKAADAGALAGAGGLYPNNSGTLLAQLAPDWTTATQYATRLVKENSAANTKLADSDIVSIEAGYWNLKQDPKGIQPQTITPRYACSGSGVACTPNAVASTCSAGQICLQQDVPVVRVTVQKTALPTAFAQVSGWNVFSATASAVAARGNPLTARLSFPFAVTKCMTDYYLSRSLSGQVIRIPDSYSAVANCNTGNWTSLNIGGNGDKIVQGLLAGTTAPATLTLGDSVQIQPGTKANLYADTAVYVGQTVYVPVVADNLAETNSWSPVTGFMAFRVDLVQATGPDKYIEGHFISYSDDPTASRLGGPLGNTVTPPVMIR